MTVWSYVAIELEEPRARRQGELSEGTEADARSALRRRGLQVIDIRPARARSDRTSRSFGAGSNAWGAVTEAIQRRRRRRRRPARAQLFDSVATLVRAGIPLLEAIETLAGSSQRFSYQARVRHAMLLGLRESLRGGASLAAAMRAQPGWFDPVEIAMIEAGQHAGTLPAVLETLAERHEQEDRLTQRLVGALLYPSIVAAAGVGVTMFLSVRTLPELVRILESADAKVPAITLWVMTVGMMFVKWGWLLSLVAAAAAMVAMPLVAIVRRSGFLAVRIDAPFPRVLRTMAVADVAIRLGELVRSGVPATEALRVLGPSTCAPLGRRLVDAAAGVERGEDLSSAFRSADRGARFGARWFEDEFLRLIEVGQTSGELDSILDRIGRRYEREARRSIERLATLLEPAVIVLLAALVGTVVMAAVLPLARMKDVI